MNSIIKSHKELVNVYHFRRQLALRNYRVQGMNKIVEQDIEEVL